MMENRAFTERVIAKAQQLSIEEVMGVVLTDYLLCMGRMAYDFERGLLVGQSPFEKPSGSGVDDTVLSKGNNK